MANNSYQEVLNRHTREGELYEKLPNGKVRCFACGHLCPIPEGRSGVCKVRFNQGGKLYVPWEYVAGIQDDPIEKKPFFHVLPGARALSFGMLGCDFHCGYCFPPGTMIATEDGLINIETLVNEKKNVKVFTQKGRKRKITHFFKRSFKGDLLCIKPAFFPEITATPEHPFFVRLRPDWYPDSRPSFIEAQNLTKNHCLTIPKNYASTLPIPLDVKTLLTPFVASFRIRRRMTKPLLERVVELTKQGLSSKEIGFLTGKSPSHIRHIRSKIRKGAWDLGNLYVKPAKLIIRNGYIRFSKEHAPGIPARLPLSQEMAELLGYYCAEGSVSKTAGRVHSASLNFAFSKKEKHLALRTQYLIKKVFNVEAYLVNRSTTLGVSTGKTSLALLFKSLCGGKGSAKCIPKELFRSEEEVIQSFLDAYVLGDGYRTKDKHIRISSISKDLAAGVFWLVQRLGYLPQFYQYANPVRRKILGRNIQQHPFVYLVRWYEISRQQRHVWEDKHYRYILIEKIAQTFYQGPVYNLEVEKENTYLANGVVVHNCQNWLTSQALRDTEAQSPLQAVSAGQLVEMAVQRKCQVMTSTYNEPLITSEWAVEVFKLAKQQKRITSYVSNGNATPQVLEYIRPWVDLYKVDLKGFDDKHYRELGGTLKNVCDSIRQVYEMGFWLEIVTLLIPGFNDSDDEITKLTEFVASVSPLIPWHVTAFHQDYKMTDPRNTQVDDLLRAVGIGKKAGLKYVYPGNLPGQVGTGENTYCHQCGELLIERFGFQILNDKLTATQGKCFSCQTKIPGVWRKHGS